MSTTPIRARERILIIGDSVILKASSDTDGLPNRMTKAYEGKADIIVRGFPFGFSTNWFVFYLEGIIKQFFPCKQRTLWILSWGMSDMLIRPDSKEPNTDIEQYGRNMDLLIQTIRSYDAHADILLLVPVPLDRERWAKIQAEGCIDKEKKDFDVVPYEKCMGYAKKAVNVAYRHGVIALDMVLSSDHWRTLLAEDGVHLSEKGNAEVFKSLTQLITESLPQWRPTQLLGDCLEFDPKVQPPKKLADEDMKYDESMET